MTKPMTSRDDGPYALTLERKPGYLRARIAASRIDRRTALEYVSEIVVECRKAHADKLLIERNIAVMIADDEQFGTMKDFVQMSLGIRIAVVNEHVPIEEAMRHSIFYGASIGGAFRYFDNVPEAEGWLLAAAA